MTTCPLCGQRDHTGPCYADLKEEWRQQDDMLDWTEKQMQDHLEATVYEHYSRWVTMRTAMGMEEAFRRIVAGNRDAA
jgi:hypothetical protein